MKCGISMIGLVIGMLATSALAQDERGWTSPDPHAEPTAPPQTGAPLPQVPPPPQSQPVYVEDPAVVQPENTFTWAPLDLVVGTVRFEYERALAPFLSLHVDVGAVLFDGVGVQIPDGASYYALGLGFGARLFMIGEAPEGFWVGPLARAAYASVEVDDASGSGVGYSVGGELGYTFLFGDVFVLSVGGGVSYIDIEAEASSSTMRVKAGSSGVVPTLRLNLGFAF